MIARDAPRDDTRTMELVYGVAPASVEGKALRAGYALALAIAEGSLGLTRSESMARKVSSP